MICSSEFQDVSHRGFKALRRESAEVSRTTFVDVFRQKSCNKAGQEGTPAEGVKCFTPEVEEAFGKIAAATRALLQHLFSLVATKVFFELTQLQFLLIFLPEKTAEIEKIISVEKSRDDDAESIITSDRYEWIVGRSWQLKKSKY